MKLQTTFEARAGYLYVRAKGQFDLRRARDIFDRVLQAARSQNVDRVLCDITAMTGWDSDQSSATTRFDIAAHVARSLPSDVKLAILETPQQLAKDKFDENVMVNRGARVKVTSELDDALGWLGGADTNKPTGGESS